MYKGINITKEDRELLLLDLSGRITYGVICNWKISTKQTLFAFSYDKPFDTNNPELWRIKEEGNIIIPYLRSLNTMTEEEREELSDYLCERVMSDKSGITFPPDPIHGKGIPFEWMSSCIDWLNAHHFDYRGLIEKGLALEAPEDMYK